MEAGYIQAAYQFGLWEPVARVSAVDVEGPFEGDVVPEDRANIGINYLFGPSLIGKVAFERRELDDPGAEDEERVLYQLAYGF